MAEWTYVDHVDEKNQMKSVFISPTDSSRRDVVFTVSVLRIGILSERLQLPAQIQVGQGPAVSVEQ